MATWKKLTATLAGVAALAVLAQVAAAGPVLMPKPYAVAKEGGVYWIRWQPGVTPASPKCADAAGYSAVYTTDAEIGNLALAQMLAGKAAYVVVNDASASRTLTGHTASPCEVVNYYVLSQDHP